jgi:hypothetical protein
MAWMRKGFDSPRVHILFLDMIKNFDNDSLRFTNGLPETSVRKERKSDHFLAILQRGVQENKIQAHHLMAFRYMYFDHKRPTQIVRDHYQEIGISSDTHSEAIKNYASKALTYLRGYALQVEKHIQQGEVSKNVIKITMAEIDTLVKNYAPRPKTIPARSRTE